jgi:hypothetical protein
MFQIPSPGFQKGHEVCESRWRWRTCGGSVYFLPACLRPAAPVVISVSIFFLFLLQAVGNIAYDQPETEPAVTAAVEAQSTHSSGPSYVVSQQSNLVSIFIFRNRVLTTFIVVGGRWE